MEKVHVWMFGVKNAVSAPQPLPIMTSPSLHFTCNQLYRQVELESGGVSRFWYVTLVTPYKGMEPLQPRASKSTPRPLPMTCGVCGAPAADVHHYGSVACYSCRCMTYIQWLSMSIKDFLQGLLPASCWGAQKIWQVYPRRGQLHCGCCHPDKLQEM